MEFLGGIWEVEGLGARGFLGGLKWFRVCFRIQGSAAEQTWSLLTDIELTMDSQQALLRSSQTLA